MKNKISVSICYSSPDFDQIDEVLNAASLISDDIHISSFNKFFNGDEERIDLLKQTYEKNKDKAQFHLIDYDSLKQYKFEHEYYLYKFCHNYLRFNNIIKTKNDYILYLDSDEVVDHVEFNKFLNTLDLTKKRSYFFDVYWYFRNKKYQATTFEASSIVMSNKNHITTKQVFDVSERWALGVNEIINCCRSLEDKPLFHHYSWAKGKDENECKELLLQKIKSWGHTTDKDWKSLIEEEFSRPFNGRDFVHGYSYKILE